MNRRAFLKLSILAPAATMLPFSLLLENPMILKTRQPGGSCLVLGKGEWLYDFSVSYPGAPKGLEIWRFSLEQQGKTIIDVPLHPKACYRWVAGPGLEINAAGLNPVLPPGAELFMHIKRPEDRYSVSYRDGRFHVPIPLTPPAVDNNLPHGGVFIGSKVFVRNA